MRLFTLLVTFLLQFDIASSSAYSLDLGSKRPYVELETDSGIILPYASNALDNVTDSVSDRTIFVALISRHGARYPTEKKLQRMRGFAQAMREGGITSGNSSLIEGGSTMLAMLGNAAPADLAPRGEHEMSAMGAAAAEAYPEIFLGRAPSRQRVYSYEVRVTTAARTVQSCKSFFRGVAKVGERRNGRQGQHRAQQHEHALPPPLSSAAAADYYCNSDDAVDDVLLRPYASCAAQQVVRNERKAARASYEEALSAEARRFAALEVLHVSPKTVRRWDSENQAESGKGAGMEEGQAASKEDQKAHLGSTPFSAWIACQLAHTLTTGTTIGCESADLTSRANSTDTAATNICTTGSKKNRDGIDARKQIEDKADSSLACRMVKPFRHAFSALEDRESFEERGFSEDYPVSRFLMARFLQHITARLRGAAMASQKRESLSKWRHKDTTRPEISDKQQEEARQSQQKADASTLIPPQLGLYFAHDSSLLPLMAMMGLVDFGTSDPSASGAARHCPFASRLIIELRKSGTIVVLYNGHVVRRFIRGLVEWEATYSGALEMDIKELCQKEPGEVSSSLLRS